MSVADAQATCEEMEFAALTRRPRRQRYFRWRGFAERLLAAVLLVPALPIMAFLIALIRLNSRGPGIYRQQRVGKDGSVFTMLKLRSMRIDAEASGPTWATGAADPRVTRLGYLLRKLHLDEFPQLFNVLRGEMSFIGPRPERPEFVAVLREEIDGYFDRLAVLPGITGLAQINLPPDTDVDSVRRKLILDREYIDTATVWLDMRIIFCTAFRMLGMSGLHAMQLMRLQRSAELPQEDSNASDSIANESDQGGVTTLQQLRASISPATELASSDGESDADEQALSGRRMVAKPR